MNDYPSRVTLFGDGIFRWSYDLDMWHNRYLLNLIIRILLLVLGIPALFVLVMLLGRAIPLMNSGLSGDRVLFFVKDDLLIFAIVAGLIVGMILLTLIIYAIAAAVMRGTWRLRFQMDKSAVALVREPGTMRALNALGAVTAVAGLVAGRPGEAMRAGSTLAVANSTGTSRFEAIRRVRILPEYDLLDLREWFGMNQIFVCREDYAFVRDFILERIPERARNRSGP